MLTPQRADHEHIITLLDDEDALYEALAAFGLPDEVASRWYAYLVEADKSITVEEANHLFNKAWV